MFIPRDTVVPRQAAASTTRRSSSSTAARGVAAAATTALLAGLVISVGGAAAQAETTPFLLQVDFGPASVAPVSGYVRDSGAAFSASRGSGWASTADAALNLSKQTRVRNMAADKRLDTFIHASYNKAAVKWSNAVPAGTYTVTIGVGDPKFYDSVHVVNVEGVRVIDKFVPSKANPFKIVTATVDVTDGFLTVDSIGGTNTKIGFVTATADIPVSSAPAPATTSAAPTPAPTTASPTPTPTPVATTAAPTPTPTATTASPTPTPTVTVVATDTTVPTRLAWFYKPPASTDEATVLNQFDTFVLTKGDETFKAKVRAAQPDAKILQYFLLDQIVKPDAGAVEWRNNAAYTPGDFDYLWTNHNDWFLKDANGNAFVEGGKYYRMDPGNAEWRAFWVQRVLAANTGWDGVFTDNLDVSLCPYDKNGVTFPKYTTDAAYTDALQGFIKYIYDNVTVANGKPVSSNLVSGCTGRDYREKYYPYLAGGMDEGWAVDWSTGYLGTSTWQAHLASVDRFAGQLGRQMILVSQGSATDTVRQQFAFASYLLVSGPNVSWRYANYSSYKVPFMFDNYASALGSPVGARFTQADGSVRRNFTNGYVVVNPSARTSSIVVG